MRLLLILTLIVIAFPTAFAQNSYLERGNSHLSKNDLDGAEKVFREGISADTNDMVLQCQLGLTLIQKEEYEEAEGVLLKVLQREPDNVGANWYSGVANFKNNKAREAIGYFEKVLPLLDKASQLNSAANWFIGKCYSGLLKTEGLTYSETDRMFECYEVYLHLQPNASDSQGIRDYVDRKKKRRPSENVKKWIDL